MMRNLLIIGILAALAAAFFASGLQHQITLENLQAQQAQLQAITQQNLALSAAVFATLYMLSTALSLPLGLLLSLTAGALFGLWLGAALVLVGATLGATLVFILARSTLGEFLRQRATGFTAQVAQGFRENAFSYLMFLRLVPAFPFAVVNILPALFNVPLKTFILTTALGILPGTLVFVNLGQSLATITSLSGLLSPQVLGAFTALGVLSLLPALIKKFRGEKPAADTESYDLLIIGGGSGGLVAAAVASQLDHRVALCEGHKMGGDCLNTGCVPSKALLAAAHAAHSAKTAGQFGVEVGKITTNFAKVNAHVHSVIGAIAPHDSVERFTQLGVTVIPHMAQFIGPKLVQAGPHRLTARRILIATGSHAFVPPIRGLKDTPFFTNETIFNLTTLPSHLVVIGGGPIGCELAQAFLRLGSRVTLLEAGPAILPKDDPELTAVVRQQLEDEGLEIHTGVKITSISGKATKLAITLENQPTLNCSHILVATGRRPNLASLNLAAANVAHTPQGITVNASLRTSNPSIYAVGDVTGPYQFTHMAGYQAGIFIQRCLFGNVLAKTNYSAVPWVTFTQPELAHVGLTEQQAQAKFGTKAVTTRFPFVENDRAQAEKQTQGFIKIITVKGKVVGASIVGPSAGELIHTWAIMVSQKFPLRSLTGVIHAYPTLSEVNKRAAGNYFKPALFAPRTQALSRLLFRWLG
ncbi:MAG: mercuric reductase [Proteobacteria bacterium]|nr:mercuric reductase [Pseudomonadota bacterium]NBX86480.1 mercuric reductase [Pseudomonadota bacterium]